MYRMIAQEEHRVHGVPNQASLFHHSLNSMSANASHRLPPPDALERSSEAVLKGLVGFTRRRSLSYGEASKMAAQNTDGLPLSVLTAHAVRALACEGSE
jgi:hypothetical protein